ncbi:hypothetical protein E1A91_A08G080100v1 [Gossypium mustelinum]|uniref:R3H-associated N-terminal domain-containing protein n=1 Tax=Gossypium mustelinum TaxID=34275 RepID=A0A5D2Y668_GOSMU|nr:hypothetical protein E1A91_A08G080100v1 [Gossypium mustelinum]
MAAPGVLQRETDLLLSSPLIELRKGENGKSRGLSIEKKIELLESLTGKVTNRRSRRWLNDRLLMELVPRLNAEEVRGLFAPPPWDCRTREALRRSFLSDLIASYEDCIRTFIQEREDGNVLALQVQDPFHRLLLHGVCEFYNVVSVTVTQSKGAELLKVTRIKKKRTGLVELPNITLSNFLKMSKEGIW